MPDILPESRGSSCSPELTTGPFLLCAGGTPSLEREPITGPSLPAPTWATRPRVPRSLEDSSVWAECESATALSSPTSRGLLELHRDKQCSSVLFQEVRWAKRKPRARSPRREDGKNGVGVGGDVCGMKEAQPSFTRGPDKNVTLGGRGAGSTDYVMFSFSASLAERSRDKDVNRTCRGTRSGHWWQALNLSQNGLFLSASYRLTICVYSKLTR